MNTAFTVQVYEIILVLRMILVYPDPLLMKINFYIYLIFF